MDWKNEIWLRKDSISEDKIIKEDLLTNLVVDREFTNYEIQLSYDTTLEEIYHDPFLMEGMEEAVSHIWDSLSEDRSILIYGDYDADGFTSTAIMFKFLKRIGFTNVDYLIPNRISEGYGLSEPTMDKILDINPDLLITVDNGIRSIEEIATLREAGIKVLLTDHHLPGEALPEADAMLDPHIETDNYPFSDLCGAGVALKLAQAVAKRYELNLSVLDELTALAMIGTIADVMPLRNENRHIVNVGLAELKNGALVGMQALAPLIGLDIEKIKARDIAFRLGPRINAAGRMGQNELSISLLLAEDIVEANVIAAELEKCNGERVKIQSDTLVEIEKYLEENSEILEEDIIVLKGESWHTGILGILAARIQDKFQKPTIICSIDADAKSESGSRLLKGSGRSEGSFNIFNVLTNSEEFLYRFGGHQNACGITVEEDIWDEFYETITAFAREEQARNDADLGENLSTANIVLYDYELDINAVNVSEIMALDFLEPFGQENKEPLYLFKDVEVLNFRTLSNGKHLKISLKHGNGNVDGIGFSLGDFAQVIKPGDKITFLANLEINEWNNQYSAQANIKSILFPGEGEQIIAKYMIDSSLADDSGVIESSDLVLFWQVISAILPDKEGIISLSRVRSIAHSVIGKSISLDLIDDILDIFVESTLLAKEAQLSRYTYKLALPNPVKRVKLSSTEKAKTLIEKGVLKI